MKAIHSPVARRTSLLHPLPALVLEHHLTPMSANPS
jgi:hypothetical protein